MHDIIEVLIPSKFIAIYDLSTLRPEFGRFVEENLRG